MTSLRRSVALAAAVFFGLSASVNAQADDGLYRDVRDPDASFVRLVVPGKSYGRIDAAGVSDLADGVSDYIHVEPGEIRVAVEEAEGSVTVAPRSYYTVILGADGLPVALTDQLQSNPAKADVSFFNLTDLDGVDLFVPRAGANVAEGIAAGAVRSVAVKAPLTLDFEVRAGGKVLATVPGVDLRRKEGVTIIATGQAGAYQAFARDNAFVN